MISTASADDEVVTFRVGPQWFGVGVLQVQEVIGLQRMARVPLGGRDIAGLLNLRGQIVTAIDMHNKLQIPSKPDESLMNVVVRDGDELFALMVDEVGEVTNVSPGAVESVPVSLDGAWGRICAGVVRMDHGLLAVLDVTHLLDEPNTRP
ncbi:MAG: chemotaxis protein CheW [Gemmatimonadota bacterium]|nr:chemotaxis protein CheW [Gemmatimonadota bacterium]